MNQELNQQESDAISEARSKAKEDAAMRIEELQKEIEKIVTEQKDLKRQKENIVNELSNTTIGNKRKELLNQKTTLDQRLNKELTEEQTRLNELIQDKQAVLMSIVASHHIELFPMEEAHKREIENIDKKVEALKDEVEDNRNTKEEKEQAEEQITHIDNNIEILKKETFSLLFGSVAHCQCSLLDQYFAFLKAISNPDLSLFHCTLPPQWSKCK